MSSEGLADFEDFDRDDGGETVVPDVDPENSEGVLIQEWRGRARPPVLDDGTLPIHVGDHVVERQKPDEATMLVVGTPLTPADEYEVQGGQTVADFNPEFPADDDVIECAFVDRTDKELDGKPSYGYPRSRLRLVAPIHDIGGDDGAE